MDNQFDNIPEDGMPKNPTEAANESADMAVNEVPKEVVTEAKKDSEQNQTANPYQRAYQTYQQNQQSNGYQNQNMGYQNNGYQNSGYQNNNYQNSNYQNNGYQNTGYQPNNYDDYNDESVMTMGDWILTLIVGFIPCVGFILYLVWAFSRTGNVNRRNYCRASLIVGAVVIAIYVILVLVFGAAILSAYS